MKKPLRLRTLLFISFTLVSAIPVLLLGEWVRQSAIQKEITAVKEKHLLLARSVTAGLARYVRDVETVFRLVAVDRHLTAGDSSVPSLLRSVHLDHVCTVDLLGNIIHTIDTGHAISATRLPPGVLTAVKSRLGDSDGIVFTDVMPGVQGNPTIYIASWIDEQRLAIGALNTIYLTEVQQSISFGELGHAAIVDKSGRVLAHPSSKWQISMKDISKVEPVRRMKAGETGVTFFFSPAVKKKMVAGFSTVPGVGWGVMIPQPIEELEARAYDVIWFAILLIVLGGLIAGLLSWWLSGFLAQPVLALAETARRFANDETRQSPELAKLVPQELHSLTNSFNAMMRDVSDANTAVSEKSKILQDTLDHMVEGIVMIDDENELVIANKNFGRFFDIPDTMLGAPVPLDVVARHMVQRLDPNNSLSLRNDPDQLIKPEAASQELTLLDGTILEQRSNPLPEGGVVVSYTDISERRRAEGRVRYLASHDELTNLPNRFTFQTRLNDAIKESERSDLDGALMYMDLDEFKDINDTLGHSVGDQVLKAVASRLKECLGDKHLIARLGGDEFGIIVSPAEGIEQLAQSIIEQISRPFRMQANELYLGVAIGITMFPRDGNEASELLKNADLAMYDAKNRRRNSYMHFDPAMNTKVQSRKSLEDDLYRAIDNEELTVAYQPSFELGSMRFTGLEALLRWRHPTRGDIPPVEFIPIAESTGMIMQLGTWVLNEACRDHADFQKHRVDPIRMCVNLSALQFNQQDLLSTVSAALSDSGISASDLELELTESMVMRDIEVAIRTLERLRNFGITVAIDDFGTGYSSLSLLSRLPLDRIKIDKSFVHSISNPANTNNSAIVAAIVGLAGSLKLPLVAEGVETREQFDFLLALGCHEFQGRYMAGPLSKPELLDWLQGQRRPASASA